MRHASKKYSSTLALLQLDTILRYSVVYGKPKPPKKGIANKNYSHTCWKCAMNW